MNDQKSLNYKRISEAIGFIKEHFRQQPSLEEVAKHVNLSPFHLQRLFTDWAGVSPKKFLQYISVEHAKQILKEKQTSLFDAAYETGLSGTGRLHDLFIKIEGMTPGEFKHRGADLSINYSFFETAFGKILVASTPKGICFMAFAEDQDKTLQQLIQHFPNAIFVPMMDEIQHHAVLFFQQDFSEINTVKLHLRGTDFQLKVWQTLLKIPMGELTTYGRIAKEMGTPNASRAVGSAIGSNPVAFLIPCHRVIRSGGEFGGYMWGNIRKTAMIGWEAAKINGDGLV